MQRLYMLLVMLVFLITVSACEEIVDPEGLPYEEKLVVHAILFADSTNNAIQITRTLPLNMPFDTSAAYLKDVVGSVTDGDVTYPLEYLGYGGFYAAKGLVPRVGRTYHFHARWNAHNAQAAMTMPEASIKNAWFEVTQREFGTAELITASILISPGASFYFGYEASGPDPELGRWHSITKGYDLFHDRLRDAEGSIIAKRLIFSGHELGTIDSLSAQAFVFSPGYADYYDSRHNDVDENLGNPALIRWNVEGDAIGIFFGCKVVSAEVKL
jgi:hypothetical protein